MDKMIKHGPTNDLLICIYSSHDDLHLAEKLRSQINSSLSLKNQNIIIVLTDIKQKEKYRYDKERSTLYLNIKECYTYLSLKTELMIEACNELFDFDFLIKWDASTIEPARCYDPRGKDTADTCLQKIQEYKFTGSHYYSHITSNCDGRKSRQWFLTSKKHLHEILIEEGRDLDAESVIPTGISHHCGKFYTMSKKFCEFISSSTECNEIFHKNFQHNFGNEDVSVGMCFIEFNKTRSI